MVRIDRSRMFKIGDVVAALYLIFLCWCISILQQRPSIGSIYETSSTNSIYIDLVVSPIFPVLSFVWWVIFSRIGGVAKNYSISPVLSRRRIFIHFFPVFPAIVYTVMILHVFIVFKAIRMAW
jgi:hypothetical protein